MFTNILLIVMFTNILLIVVGIVFAGLMFYAFFIVLFSKHDDKNIPKADIKKAPANPDKKFNH